MPPMVNTILIGLALAGITLAEEQEFEIDNIHSSCIFSVSHFDIGYIYGRFNKVGGTAKIDKESPEKSSFEFKIDANSIDTNNESRDLHLKGPDFFDVKNFADITFKSTSVTVEKGVFKATGTMAIRGVEKQVEIPLQLLGVGKGPFGDVRIGMIGKFVLKRTDFGMNKLLEGVGDNVAITFSFEGVQK